MTDKAIAVFTRKSAARILAEGGSGHWLLNGRNALKHEYLVCVRNAKSSEIGANEKPGSAFLIGRIRGIVPTDTDRRGQQRSLISINEYAPVDIPNVWQKWRNPVRYTTLEELEIDPAALSFRPCEAADELREMPHCPFTIEEAKRRLAATFGVVPDAIRIIIRG